MTTGHRWADTSQDNATWPCLIGDAHTFVDPSTPIRT